MGLETSILVTGSHRSGTTWVGNILALANGTRYVQEPFNRETNPTLEGYRLANMYAYALDEDKENLKERYRAYLARRPHERLIIKDPIALFSAPWIQEEFGVKVLCIVRHPAGFVSSLIKWQWEFFFGYFTAQPKLMDTFPASIRTEIEHYAKERQEPLMQACLLWKVLYGWVIDQCPKKRRWQVLRYEEIAGNPRKHFRKLYRKLELRWSAGIEEEISRLSGRGNPGESDDPGFKARNSLRMREVWMDRLTSEQIQIVQEQTAPVWQHFYSDKDWKLRYDLREQ